MTLEEQEHSRTVAISNEPHQSEVQELREQFAMLLNKVLPSLLMTVDVHSYNRQGDIHHECLHGHCQARRDPQCWQCG